MKKVILLIEGMTCSACSNGLEKYLNKQKGIKQAVVNLIMNTASVEYDNKLLNLSNLEQFVENAGFKSLGIYNPKKKQKKSNSEKSKLIGISILSIFVLYVSMSHMVGLPTIPYLQREKYPLNYSICLFLLTSSL